MVPCKACALELHCFNGFGYHPKWMALQCTNACKVRCVSVQRTVAQKCFSAFTGEFKSIKQCFSLLFTNNIFDWLPIWSNTVCYVQYFNWSQISCLQSLLPSQSDYCVCVCVCGPLSELLDYYLFSFPDHRPKNWELRTMRTQRSVVPRGTSPLVSKLYVILVREIPLHAGYVLSR